MKKKGKLNQKESLWVAFGQFVTVAMSFIGIKIFTNYLDPVVYGEIAICLSLAALLNQTIFSPVSSGLARFYPLAIESKKIHYLLAGIRKIVFRAILGILLIGSGAALFLLIFENASWSILILLATVFAILNGIYSLNMAYLNSARLRLDSALFQGLEPIARYLIASLLVINMKNSSSIAIAGFICALILILLVQYFSYWHRRVKLKYASEKTDVIENVWKYIWPISISGLTSWTFMSSQIWALQLFGDEGDVGYYSVIIQLGFTPFTMLGSFATTLMIPVIFEIVGDGSDVEKLKIIYKKIVFFSAWCVLGILFASMISVPLHQHVFELFASSSFAKYSQLLPAAIMAGGLLQVSIFLSVIPMIFMDTKIFLPLNTYGNFIIAISNLLFTYKFGIYGLFSSMILGSLFHMTWNIFNITKIKKLHFNRKIVGSDNAL